MVITPGFFKQEAGSMVKFKPLSTVGSDKKNVHVTAKFRHDHAHTADAVMKCCSMKGSNWTLLSDASAVALAAGSKVTIDVMRDLHLQCKGAIVVDRVRSWNGRYSKSLIN